MQEKSTSLFLHMLVAIDMAPFKIASSHELSCFLSHRRFFLDEVFLKDIGHLPRSMLSMKTSAMHYADFLLELVLTVMILFDFGILSVIQVYIAKPR